MSYGENYGTSTLFDELQRLSGFVYDSYADGDLEQAVEDAKNLMQGSAELWSRLVEERAEVNA